LIYCPNGHKITILILGVEMLSLLYYAIAPDSIYQLALLGITGIGILMYVVGSLGIKDNDEFEI
jgi:Na+/proline symporter